MNATGISTVAKGASRPAFCHEEPRSIPGQVMYDTCWKMWYWDRFVFESYGFSPLLIVPLMLHINLFVYHEHYRNLVIESFCKYYILKKGVLGNSDLKFLVGDHFFKPGVHFTTNLSVFSSSFAWYISLLIYAKLLFGYFSSCFHFFFFCSVCEINIENHTRRI